MLVTDTTLLCPFFVMQSLEIFVIIKSQHFLLYIFKLDLWWFSSPWWVYKIFWSDEWLRSCWTFSWCDRWELLCWKRSWFYCCYKCCVPRQDKYSLFGKNLIFYFMKLIYIKISSKHLFFWELTRSVFHIFMSYVTDMVAHARFCLV